MLHHDGRARAVLQPSRPYIIVMCVVAALTYRDLSSSTLVSLAPDTFAALTGLTVLSLSSMYLAAWPEAIFASQAAVTTLYEPIYVYRYLYTYYNKYHISHMSFHGR